MPCGRRRDLPRSSFLVGPIGGGALPSPPSPSCIATCSSATSISCLAWRSWSACATPPHGSSRCSRRSRPASGCLWFAGRREWRKVLVAGAVTLLIGGLSFAISPDLWFDWVSRLRGDTQRAGRPYVTLIGVRPVLAAAIVLYAGWRGRAWLIPVAIVLALPILWPDSLAILLACFPLLRVRR